jgi:Fe-S cluster assembly scaffold protein SufB
MSDRFNPLHYLDKRLINESPATKTIFGLAPHLAKRKSEFNSFLFIVTNEKGLIHSEATVTKTYDKNKAEYQIDEQHKKIFWLRINHCDNTIEETITLPKGAILIHEDVSLNWSSKETTINCLGNNSYYYLNQHLHNQLFFNKVNFLVHEQLKSYFFTLSHEQKHKNQIDYQLTKESNLEHYSLSNIQKGQLQDDSINVIHAQNSHSKINYQSLNKGKVVSQVNSLVAKESIGCSTEQNLKHITLEKTAITNSKPNLMISNNDIVASHGNSIGSFNSEDLFYLGQRGLTKEQAYLVLASSITSEYISKTEIQEELTNYLKGRELNV